MLKSIGTRLALQMAAVLLIVMTGFSIVEVQQQQKKYTAFSDAKEKDALKPLALILSNLLFNLERERMDATITSYLNTQDILAIKILEENVLSHYWGKVPATGEIADFKNQPAPQYPQAALQTTELIFDAQPLGTLEVIFSRKFVDEQIRETILKLSQSFLLVIAVATVMLVLLARNNVTRPLLNLTQAARLIAEGDIAPVALTARATRDEIGVLTTTFQAMMTYLQEITQVASSISTGDLRSSFTPRSPKDLLGQAFQRMSAYLREMAFAAAAIAEGDLRENVQPRTEHDALGLAFQKMNVLHQSVCQMIAETQQLRTASQNLNQISTQMATDSEETAQQVQAVAATSQQINQNVHEISTAAEELAASVREIAHHIGTVRDISSAAVTITNAASATIATLKQHSQEIGEFIKLITTITQQTNILALNATIEAARAGESGKGFAVVANEVKNLAQEITISAEDITRRVETIQTSTSAAVNAMTQIAGITMQVHETSRIINASIGEQTIMANEISRNISDAAKGSGEITRAMLDIATVVQNSSAQAMTVQNAAEVLLVLADQLQQAIGKFKI